MRGRCVFAVTGVGDEHPTILLGSVHTAEQVLGTEFWELPDGGFESEDDRWSGQYLPAADAVALLYGLADTGPALRVVASC